MDKNILDWLMEGPAWIRYAVELQLLDGKPDIGPVLKDAGIKKIIDRLKGDDAGIPAIKAGRVHYTAAGKAYWDLFLLADIGLTIADTGLENEAEMVFRFQASDGNFSMPPNVKDNYLCMSAILISSLARMGYRDDPRVLKYIRAALSTQMPGGGWDCYGDTMGVLESCPMDDLNILMLLGQYPQHVDNPGLYGAIDCLLEHWEEGSHLYGFGVGKRFRSLLYPAVKYGILRVLDVLSLFPHAVESKSFHSMLELVHSKAENGKYMAEDSEPAYSDMDFGRKFELSRWITFLVARIDKRVKELG